MITNGEFAIIQKVDGEHLRLCRILKGQNILIEKLKFDPKSAIGKPFGMFEVGSGGKVLTPILTSADDSKFDSPQLEDISEENGNEQLNIEGKEIVVPRQQLTAEEIETLKEEGIAPSDLVSKLVQGNASFSNRTEFSKQKYVRKKTQKYSDRILISRPCIRLLCQSYYRKEPDRLAHLRLDQLGFLLQLLSVHSGGCNVFIYEQALGLVGAAILERLAGQGNCVFLHKGDWPQSIPCIDAMNFDEKQKQPFLPLRITTLLIDEEDFGADKLENAEEQMSEKRIRLDNGESQNSREKKVQRNEKEQVALKLLLHPRSAEVVDAGPLDAICLVCSQINVSAYFGDFDPVEVLQRTYAALRLSGSVVVYSPIKQHLLHSWQWLRSTGAAVDIQLSQQFSRAQQVLPNRTHPLMQQQVTGGYILHATKVLATTQTEQ